MPLTTTEQEIRDAFLAREFGPDHSPPFVEDDGGRAEAGYRGTTGDCAVRAAAIASSLPYQQVYDMTNAAAVGERRGKRKRGVSNARTGVYRQAMQKVMAQLGAEWVPTMQIGSGCTVHLRADELPPGRLVLSLSRHYAAVIDGVLRDLDDCSRNGTRCVYGYWRLEEAERVMYDGGASDAYGLG